MISVAHFWFESFFPSISSTVLFIPWQIYIQNSFRSTRSFVSDGKWNGRHCKNIKPKYKGAELRIQLFFIVLKTACSKFISTLLNSWKTALEQWNSSYNYRPAFCMCLLAFWWFMVMSFKPFCHHANHLLMVSSFHRFAIRFKSRSLILPPVRKHVGKSSSANIDLLYDSEGPRQIRLLLAGQRLKSDWTKHQ